MRHLFLCFLCTLYLVQLTANETELTKEKIEVYSEYIGYKTGEEFQTISKYCDIDAVIRGLINFKSGIKPKSMVEHEQFELLVQIQNEIFEKKSAENLALAEAFLENVSKQKEAIEIVEKKLYYKVLKEGSGIKEISSTSTPIFRYKVSTIDEIVVLDEKNPSPICLDDTIVGFEKGTIGMKRGEQRKLYIHPDFAYRKSGQFPPNSLLILEIEAVEVDS